MAAAFAESNRRRLDGISEALSRKLRHFAQNRQFTFLHPPAYNSPASGTFSEEDCHPSFLNTGPFSLCPNAPSNEAIFSFEEWLFQSMSEVERMKEDKDAVTRVMATSLARALEQASYDAEQWRVTEWERQRLALSPPDSVVPNHTTDNKDQRTIDTESFMSHIYLAYPPTLMLVLLLAAVLHLLCGVSIDQTVFLMDSLKMLLVQSADGDAAKQRRLAAGIPSDVRGALKALDLEPKTEAFVCCTKCFALYPISGNLFPPQCTYRRASDSSPCGESLTSTRRVKGVVKTFPCRRFVRQDFHDWLGRLLCRPGMEQLMDSSVRSASGSSNGASSDIWDAPVLRTIKLPDGRMFLDMKAGEGRYVFSICIDGLLPQGKGSGPAVSVGSIFLACLNLPPNLRYRYENMYLAGVIPGPKHPKKDQINRILEVVLEPFRESYEHGVTYAKTPLFPGGKHTVSIIVPLVADTIAAHQMNGNAGPTHRLGCPFCKLKKDNWENMDYDQWPRRTAEENIEIARRWMNALTVKEQEDIYEEHGIRWSAMLTLPYWDPVAFLAIDLMHNLFLGLLAHFITSVWGISSEEADGLDGVVEDPQTHKPSPSDMEEARRVARHESLKSVEGLRLKILRELAKELGVKKWKTTKEKLVRYLEEVRVSKQWFTKDGVYIPESPSADRKEGSTVHKALLDVQKHVRSTIEKHSYVTLVEVCVNLLGGSRTDYSGRRKEDILDLIDNYRKHNGIIGEDGSLLKQKAKPKDQPQLDEDQLYQRAQSTLHEGTKSELGKLQVQILVKLCQEFVSSSHEWQSKKKPELLASLYQYRVDAGITDISGKLLVKRITEKQRQQDARPVEDQELREAEVTLESGSKTNLERIRVPVLVALCLAKMNKVARNRMDAMKALHEYRKDNGIVDEQGKVLLSRKKRPRNRVLGKATLARVWRDMENLHAPTSLTRAPPTIGSSGQGTISADEWRTFCTVNLPMTLIAMWGLKDKDSRERKLLDNFLDLVKAVNCASTRITTQKRRDDYSFHMKRHLQTMLELFPGTTITPNQHKALHQQECLSFLGPSHVLWCYGFERGNHELQKISTNNKIYEMSTTLFKRFCYKQNLRHLFSRSDFPPQLCSIVSKFSRCFSIWNSGTLSNALGTADPDPEVEEMLSLLPEPTKGTALETAELPQDILAAFQTLLGKDKVPHVRRLAHFEDAGDDYRPYQTALGNSYVAFSFRPADGWRAGRIRDIFQHTKALNDGEYSTETYLAVDEYEPLDPLAASIDPYEREKLGRMYRARFHGPPQIITRDQLLCPSYYLQTHIDGFPYAPNSRPQNFVVLRPHLKW